MNTTTKTKTTFTHATADGTVCTRKSVKDFTYVVEGPDSRKADYPNVDWTFDGIQVISWHTTRELAWTALAESGPEAKVVKINNGLAA